MEAAHLTPEPAREDRRGGRPAAGTDPQKRRQILEGAGRIFSTAGFDASSMSDVAREARVSKATLYVYFQDKEHLSLRSAPSDAIATFPRSSRCSIPGSRLKPF